MCVSIRGQFFIDNMWRLDICNQLYSFLSTISLCACIVCNSVIFLYVRAVCVYGLLVLRIYGHIARGLLTLVWGERWAGVVIEAVIH
uniref:Uncharacterized protein n=1 Tax=Arion vulgaris TaxID=1028688 RepID=A0A0B7AYB0_9EUPU